VYHEKAGRHKQDEGNEVLVFMAAEGSCDEIKILGEGPTYVWCGQGCLVCLRVKLSVPGKQLAGLGTKREGARGKHQFRWEVTNHSAPMREVLLYFPGLCDFWSFTLQSLLLFSW
jgi:hypothetical protein